MTMGSFIFWEIMILAVFLWAVEMILQAGINTAVEATVYEILESMGIEFVPPEQDDNDQQIEE